MIHYTIRPGLNGIVPGAFRLRVENENVTGNYLIIITGYFNPGLKILEWVKKKFPKILFAPTRPLRWAASHRPVHPQPINQLEDRQVCCAAAAVPAGRIGMVHQVFRRWRLDSYNLLHVVGELGWSPGGPTRTWSGNGAAIITT